MLRAKYNLQSERTFETPCIILIPKRIPVGKSGRIGDDMWFTGSNLNVQYSLCIDSSEEWVYISLVRKNPSGAYGMRV